MTKDKALKQALELIERLNMRGWILADFEDEVYATLDSLKAALLQPPPFYQPAANEAVEISKSLSYVYEPTYKSCARCLHKPTWPDTSVVCGGCRFYSNFRANPPLPVQPEQESNHD